MLNLFFLPKKKILSLDIGSCEIKAIIGKETEKGIIIDDYLNIPTPKNAYNDGNIVDKDLIHYVIKDELIRKKIKCKDIYLNINSSEIITREVSIPKVEYEEIESILKFQLEDYIPMNSDNYIVQFKIIRSTYEDDLEKLILIIIAIPRQLVESHFRLLKDLNKNPLVLDYQPNSIAKLIKYNEFINDTYPTKDITFAAVDIGYDSTKVSIIKNGIILVSRTVEIGGKYIDKNILNFFEYSEDELMEIKNEINNINLIESEYSDYNRVVNIIKNTIRSLIERIDVIFKYYLTRCSENEINMILLFGGNANINGMNNLFSNFFNIPSIRLESFDNVKFNGNIVKYANSIGSIIRSMECSI